MHELRSGALLAREASFGEIAHGQESQGKRERNAGCGDEKRSEDINPGRIEKKVSLTEEKGTNLILKIQQKSQR